MAHLEESKEVFQALYHSQKDRVGRLHQQVGVLKTIVSMKQKHSESTGENDTPVPPVSVPKPEIAIPSAAVVEDVSHLNDLRYSAWAPKHKTPSLIDPETALAKFTAAAAASKIKIGPSTSSTPEYTDAWSSRSNNHTRATSVNDLDDSVADIINGNKEEIFRERTNGTTDRETTRLHPLLVNKLDKVHGK